MTFVNRIDSVMLKLVPIGLYVSICLSSCVGGRKTAQNGWTFLGC